MNMCVRMAFAAGWGDAATSLTTSQARAIAKQLGKNTDVLPPATASLGGASCIFK